MRDALWAAFHGYERRLCSAFHPCIFPGVSSDIFVFLPIWALQDVATLNHLLDLTLAFLKDKRFLSLEV